MMIAANETGKGPIDYLEMLHLNRDAGKIRREARTFRAAACTVDGRE